MPTQFVSEAMRPIKGSVDIAAMAGGGPGLPARFSWRGQNYSVAEVLDQWRETAGCHSGGNEQYVRKHWFRVLTEEGLEMKIYFERQARSRRDSTRRWWLHTLTTPDAATSQANSKKD